MTIAFAALAIFSPLIHIFAGKHPRTKEIFVDLYFKYFLFWIVGIMGVVAFLGHTFMANEIAESIGWATGSPFQFEVAVANLGFGIGGLIALKQRMSFSLGVLISWGIFLIGAGFGHIYQLQVNHDYAINNAGPIMYSDFIFPIAGILLYWMKSKYTGGADYLNPKSESEKV